MDIIANWIQTEVDPNEEITGCAPKKQKLLLLPDESDADVIVGVSFSLYYPTFASAYL